MKVAVVEIEQEMDGGYATIFTLATGQKFKCLRIDAFMGRLSAVVVRDDGAIEYDDPHTGEPVTLVPIWLHGDPRE